MALAMIRIEGTPAQLRALNAIADLHLAPASTERPADDHWIVYGYADAAARAAVEAVGATVTEVQSEAEVTAHLASTVHGPGADDDPIV